MIKLLVSSLTVLALTACAQPQGDDRLKEKADIEAESGQKKADERALEMEARLTRQQRFFQGVAGTFAGKMKIPGEKKDYNVRFVLTPSIAAYTGERTRTMDEITYDLTNLTLNIEETTTFKMSDGSDYAMGCVFTDIKPKTDQGFIHATAGNCPTTFMLNLATGAALNPDKVREMRDKVSEKLLSGVIDQIDILQIEMRSVHRAGSKMFSVERVQ